MGRLFHRSTRRYWPLAAEQIVGRAPHCALSLDAASVSTHHADIRWSDKGWLVKDLGSLNGTFVNGERLATGTWRVLRTGDGVSFGDPEAELWELTEDARPCAMVSPLCGGAPLPVPEGMLGVPVDAPEATIWEDEHGSWWLEPTDRPATPLQHGEEFEVAGVRYRFSCDSKPSTTQLVKQGHDVHQAGLSIRYSRDEEHVEAVADFGGTKVSLGDRQHHSLLLSLARHRLDDRRAGVPEGSCGWMYLEDLMDELKVDRPQLNLHVYRVRKQFLAAGLRNAAAVIERRVQTRQLRLGFKELVVMEI